MIFPLADALFLILLPDCESIFAVICRACADVQRAEFNAASFPAARQTMSTHTNAHSHPHSQRRQLLNMPGAQRRWFQGVTGVLGNTPALVM